MARKLEEHRRARAIPELDPIKALLDPLIVAERTERHESPPWFASAYHLVDRRKVELYASTAAAVRTRLEAGGVRAQISGPWAPYAFAPGILA